jgi:hypothetical protein
MGLSMMQTVNQLAPRHAFSELSKPRSRYQLLSTNRLSANPSSYLLTKVFHRNNVFLRRRNAFLRKRYRRKEVSITRKISVFDMILLFRGHLQTGKNIEPP